MAKFTLKADTKDAQKKLKDLRKEIDKLDKDAAKKREIQMKGALKKSGIATGGMGLVGTAAVSMGSFVGNMGANLVSSALSKLASAIGAVIPLILKFGFGFNNIIGMASKWGKALEVAGNAPEHALKAADTLDALDDERRAHNNKSNAEEYAWDRAFKDYAGDAYKNQLIQRIENLRTTALGGDEESIKQLAALDYFDGNKWSIGSELENLSTHELFYKILESYNKRKAQGDLSLAPILEKVIGARGMGVIGKLGDVSNLTSRRDAYIEAWNKAFSGLTDEEIKKMSPDMVDAIAKNREALQLEYADAAEKIRGEGDVYNYVIPRGGMQNVRIGAQNQADAAKLASQALTNDGKQILDAAMKEAGADLETLSTQYNNSPFGKWITNNIVNPISGFAEKVSTKINEFVEVAGSRFEEFKDKLEEIQNKLEEPAEFIKKHVPWGDYNLSNIGQNELMQAQYGSIIPTKIWTFGPDDPDKAINPSPVTPSERQIAAFGKSAYTALGMSEKQAEEMMAARNEMKSNTEALKKMTDAVRENTNKSKIYSQPQSILPNITPTIPTFQ